MAETSASARVGDSKRLDGQVAIVTGCARLKGIGRGIAIELAGQGAILVVTDISSAGTRNAGEGADADGDWYGLDSLVEELKAKGAEAMGLLGDVGIKEDAERIVQETLNRYGRVDILVNNAASPHGEDRRPIWEVTEEAYDTVMRVNAKGVFLMSAAVIRHFLKRRGSGRIVNISSDAGKNGAPRLGPYCASKFAVIGLTQVMARELGPKGITVNAVCPGLIDTARHASTSASAASGEKSDMDMAALTAALAGVVPRVGTPKDIGAVVAFLASPESSYMNGQSIIVDGGLFMS